MAVKLSSRQLAQLAYLESLPPRFGRIHAVIEEMSALRADDVVVRGLARLLDQIKAESGALSLTGMAETAGLMSTMTRRGGGLQMTVRGLRELLGQQHHDASDVECLEALRHAATAEEILDRIGAHVRIALEQLVDGEGPRLVGAKLGERPLERAPDRGPNGVDDYGFRHLESLLRFVLAGSESQRIWMGGPARSIKLPPWPRRPQRRTRSARTEPPS